MAVTVPGMSLDIVRVKGGRCSVQEQGCRAICGLLLCYADGCNAFLQATIIAGPDGRVSGEQPITAQDSHVGLLPLRSLHTPELDVIFNNTADERLTCVSSKYLDVIDYESIVTDDGGQFSDAPREFHDGSLNGE